MRPVQAQDAALWGLESMCMALLFSSRSLPFHSGPWSQMWCISATRMVCSTHTLRPLSLRGVRAGSCRVQQVSSICALSQCLCHRALLTVALAGAWHNTRFLLGLAAGFMYMQIGRVQLPNREDCPSFWDVKWEGIHSGLHIAMIGDATLQEQVGNDCCRGI